VISDHNVPDLDVLLQWNVYGYCTAAAFLVRLQESPFEHGKDPILFHEELAAVCANLAALQANGMLFSSTIVVAFQRFLAQTRNSSENLS
jgi:hypothetical protein